MIKRFMLLLAVLAFVFPLAVRAQTPATAPAAFDPNIVVAPYIDGQTIAVVHVDAAGIDTGALASYATALFDAAKIPADDPNRPGISEARAVVDVFLARFKQLGGRHAFLVLAQPDIWPNLQPVAVLVKIEPGRNAQAMADFLKQGFAAGGEVAVLKDDVVFVGMAKALQRLQTLKAEPRPELALAPAEAPIQAVAALTADQRRVIREMLPVLPAEAGGGSTEFLTRTPVTMHLLVQLPPKPSVTLAFTQPQPSPGWVDPAATRNVYTGSTTALRIRTSWPVPEIDGLIIKLRDLLLASDAFQQALNDPVVKTLAPELPGLVKELLTPKDGMLQISDKQLNAFLRLTLISFNRAQSLAQRSVSAANLRAIAQSACVYAADNKDMLPSSLDVMVANNQLSPKQLINPDDPKHRPYIYRVIIPESLTDASVPLAWEQVDDDVSGLNVAFGDGHVEWVRNRKELDTYIKNAEVLKAQLDAQRKAREAQTQPAPH